MMWQFKVFQLGLQLIELDLWEQMDQRMLVLLILLTYLLLPNFIVMAASDEAELVRMINTSVDINRQTFSF